MSKVSAASDHPATTPAPDAGVEHPPIIRRAEVVAFSLVSLLVITVLLILYFAKAFFLPVVTAFIVGTMLSPAAGFLEKRRIPRALSSVMIVLTVGAGAVFIIGLISAPL
ncbi:MAG: AI-2E family transporter, partial [Hyphomicrobiales bacterium]|nr:AI-2E family transporter [Hyphomicrobiales bacterium]